MNVDKPNIPISVEELARNLLNEDNYPHVRENYKNSLLDIIKFCNDVVAHYDSRKSRGVGVFNKKKKN